MANKELSFRDESRRAYTFTGESATRHELAVGALLRIADATEAMAVNYTELQARCEGLQKELRRMYARYDGLARSKAALQGWNTRLKAALDEQENTDAEC